MRIKRLFIWFIQHVLRVDMMELAHDIEWAEIESHDIPICPYCCEPLSKKCKCGEQLGNNQ